MQHERHPPLGIIMLDVAIERPPGDVGHSASWPFDVVFRTVPGATARKIVNGDDVDLMDAFVAAGDELRADGAIGLITSCGFLASRQSGLSARMSLPLATSSLLQLPMVERCLTSGRRAGVVTYDAEALTDGHFAGAGADPRTPRVGLPPDGSLRAHIEHGRPYDRDGLRRDVHGAVSALLSCNPGIGAIVFECTNLPPFSQEVSREFGLPVYDIITLGRWFYSGLIRSAYSQSPSMG
ncbi:MULTISPECIES: aspartate/glutamate racemase family protein [unclassified Bradyrhizobium]|uniref:aspartate/glutamate racemase family protein n=1 Tax=unclassified Bradyrhizobium TaxID=2631580 RepID=UPI002160E0C1|nr:MULTISPECIES: aspartate/glutamate racemase family protein [unclassified Bradyrhizobium]